MTSTCISHIKIYEPQWIYRLPTEDWPMTFTAFNCKGWEVHIISFSYLEKFWDAKALASAILLRLQGEDKSYIMTINIWWWHQIDKSTGHCHHFESLHNYFPITSKVGATLCGLLLSILVHVSFSISQLSRWSIVWGTSSGYSLI